MVLTQEASCLGHPGLVLVLEECLPFLFCIFHHATEFVDVEGLAAQSDARLLIDGRASAKLDEQVAEEYER